jgi:hypothetical protein
MVKKKTDAQAPSKNEPAQWRSKIVGHGKVAASQLLANPFNHRRHPQKQRDVVSASIQELGFIKSVIVNQLTGHIVDGHERVMQALGVGEETLVDVEYVELSPEDEKKALLVLDASSELAEIDASALDQLVAECSFGEGVLSDLSKQMLADCGKWQEDDEQYTRKIVPPTYSVTGQKPSVAELQSLDKYNELVSRIEASKGLSKELKKFLIMASTRHVVFDYEKIAEFYAHSSKEEQALIEDSALVLIDMDNAIAKGYCQLSMDLSVQYSSETAEDDNE